MATTDPSGTIDRLRSTALDLVSLVAGADPGRFRAVPSPGEWSAATVVAHLADTELVYGVRLRMILTVDRPWLVSFPEEAWADRFGPLEPDAKESLQRWRSLRDANLRVFAGVAGDEWTREGVHDERGTLTVAALAGLLADHDRAHLGQIRQALAASG